MTLKAKVLAATGETIVLLPADEDQIVSEAFGLEVSSKDQWNVIFEVSLEPYTEPGTYDQLKAFWSIVRIICLEEYRKSNKRLMDVVYRGLLEEYGPDEELERYKSRVVVWKRTLSEMNWTERSQMIEGALAEASERVGGDFSRAAQIRNYMIEWKNWRYRVKGDRLDETYKSIDDYKRRNPYCEAEGSYLGIGGHMAHIVSRGASGSFDPWNLLHLGEKPHLMTQHAKGWVEFLRLYPHLMGKVNAARERSGKKPLDRPEALLKDLWEE